MALSGRGDGEFSNMIYNQNTDRNVWEQRDSNNTFRPQTEVTYLEIRFFFAPLNAKFTQMLNINYHVNFMPDDYPE